MASSGLEKPDFASAIAAATDQRGVSLSELSNGQRTLVVFLRHSGCTFCREALADIAAQREGIERTGVQLAIVHMGSPEAGIALLAKYRLEDVSLICDPEQRLYRAFELERGNLWQVLGPQVWWRGLRTAIFARHGFGRITADVWQLPGVFLLDHGKIVRSFRPRSSADRPNYSDLACQVH